MATVSIITRTLDRPILLERMLLSLVAQTYQDWECVIVDSGKPGPVQSLLEKHQEKLAGRVRHTPFQNPRPGMRGTALNAGIHAGTAPYITVLDDDDTWHADFLTTAVATLQAKMHPSVRGVVCRTRVIEETSVEDGLQVTHEYDLNPEMSNVTLASLAMVNRYCIHAFVYERSALGDVGLYPEDYPVLEDWHFNLRFVLRHEIQVIPQTLTYYHFRPPQQTGSEANSQTAERTDHKFHEARLINDALRQDIRDGKPGLGQVLAQAAMTRHLTDVLHRHEGRLKVIGEKTGKIDARTKELKDKVIPRR